jgi:hypothetical protein
MPQGCVANPLSKAPATLPAPAPRRCREHGGVGLGHGERKAAAKPTSRGNGATLRRTATARQTTATWPSPRPALQSPVPGCTSNDRARPHRSQPLRHRHGGAEDVGDQQDRYGRSMTPQAVNQVMRCHTIHVRRTDSSCNRDWGSCWLSLVVGLGGLEPPTSSLSAKYREPLCESSFSQVTLNRRGRSYVLS